MRSRPVSAVVVTACLAVVLAGCSSGGSTSDATPTAAASPTTASASPTPSASPTASPSPTGEAPGEDPGTWAPLQVTPDANGSIIQIVEGQHVVFGDLPKAKNLNVTTSNESAVVVEEPLVDGKAVTIPATASGVGAARIVIVDGKPGAKKAKQLMQVVFQVVRVGTTDAPGNKAPIVVSADMDAASLEPGMILVFGDIKLKGATYKSNDENIVFFPAQPETNGNPFAIAVGMGTTTVRVKKGKTVAKLTVTVTPATQPTATPTESASASPTS